MKKIGRNRRKNNINTAKLGVIFIVSAMALAGIGAGFAAWTDTVYIDGTVSTGSVEWEVIDYSGTYVWKVFGADDTGYGPETVVTGDPNFNVPPEEGFLVAYAEAMPHAGDLDVFVEFDNLFPCIWFKADIVIKYTGLIPGKINDIIYSYTPEMDWLEPLIASGDIYATARDEAGNVVEIGYQLHENDVIFIELWIHIPQDNDLMLKSGAFTATFIVAQWNEYPYEGGECGEETPIGHHADVMLTLDNSGSIVSAGATGTLKDAAKAFVTALLSPDDGQVGIVCFNWTATLLSTFDTDVPTLHGIIDGLGFGGNTNLEDGIIVSQNELATADRTPDSDPDPEAMYPDFMVIVTDGVPTAGGDAVDDATAAKAAGTTIFVLGIGFTDPTSIALMESIASTDCYYDVADWADLEAVLLSLVTG